jgi:hypothetical protein
MARDMTRSKKLPIKAELSVLQIPVRAGGAQPAGPEPLPPAQPGAAIEVDRTVSRCGAVSLASRYVLPAEILGGRRVAIRV